MANKEVMNEEVMVNEETTEVIETPVEESKIKKIWNKIKKPLSYAAVLALGVGIGLATIKTVGDSDQEDTEETVEE